MANDAQLRALAERWAGAHAAERANFQPYLIEICEALGVERPGPAGSGYQFELPVKVITRDGVEVSNFIDCHRKDYFAIEAKDEEPGKSTEILLRRAFGQLRHYASHAPGGLPPYLIVMDVARTAIVWDRWDGGYGDWQAGRRIDLTRLHERPDDAAFLRTIWTDPESLDPRARAQAVTKDVAAHLANLARALEDQGYEQERVARFIMRCVFTMFAEDIGLVGGEPFRQILERCTDDPAAFPEQATALWNAMDTGSRFEWKKLLRFNGHFFREPEALPLSKQAILILRLAAEADWQDVEPAIFGTLLTRALQSEERHRLGAEFTPREFVERVVRPAVEDPIRERWKAEQVAVLQLREAGRTNAAAKRLRAFHAWMKRLRFLDPACGSGNFLYVTMHLVKRIEVEVLRELDEVTGKHEMLFEEVHPKQFFGIEIKPWAREIAELVLWIGYHQFWRTHHTHRPQEPILEDTGTIECRDAVLAWDGIQHDPTRDRSDSAPRLKQPVTGELIPDPMARLKYMEYVNPRPASWPQADFIVGNPPYIGVQRQRAVLGDGYVDALRAAYVDVPDGADYVMYWWYLASEAIAAGTTLRAGLITTNSIVQKQNREVVLAAERKGAVINWAIADHPWSDEAGGAAIRVAMTVVGLPTNDARLVQVDDLGNVVREIAVSRLNADLTSHVDIVSASRVRLLSNNHLAFRGVALVGEGFVLTSEHAARLRRSSPGAPFVIRPLRNGRDIADRPRGLWVIDFGLRSEAEARATPVLYDLVRTTVKPRRDAQADAGRKRSWWQFGRSNEDMRAALAGLSRFLVTPMTSRHRIFSWLPAEVVPDQGLIVIATDDAFVLAVLSSAYHVTWAKAAGGRLGVGNDDRYNNTLAFAPFPFPAATSSLRTALSGVAERLDAHRTAAIARDERVTMTRMYNIVEKIRSGKALTSLERTIHEIAACGVLNDLHDELDALVANAYGWEWPLEKEVLLERLVALHDERVGEEKSGQVRWLRPDYQIPRFGKGLVAPAPSLDLVDGLPKPPKKEERPTWPGDVISQIGAIKGLLVSEALSAAGVAARFKGAKPEIVRRHLEILSVMGEVQQNPDGRYQGAR